jgi:hypothetical protein
MAKPFANSSPTRREPTRPGPDGGGDGVDRVERGARFLEGGLDDAGEERDVGAGGILGDDAPVGDVNVLRLDHVRDQPPVIEDRGARVVAGSLEAEDAHGVP